MPQGLIVKALSGYYYVLPEGVALLEGNTVTCRGRGVFKNRNITPLVGDRVMYEDTENGEGNRYGNPSSLFGAHSSADCECERGCARFFGDRACSEFAAVG